MGLWQQDALPLCLSPPTGRGLNDVTLQPWHNMAQTPAAHFPYPNDSKTSHQALSQNLFPALMFPALPLQSPFFVLFVRIILSSGPAPSAHDFPAAQQKQLQSSLESSNITVTQSSNKTHLFTANPNATKIKVYPKIVKNDLNLDPRTFIWAGLLFVCSSAPMQSHGKFNLSS